MSSSEEKRLERMELKLDDLSDHLSAIDVTLGAQHISLKEHIRRTAILEADIRPVKRHIAMVEGVLKFMGALATIAAILEAIHVISK